MEQIQMEQIRTAGKRIQWIDFAKGIGILLVIVGHTAKNSGLIFTIYSFHMPLFFAVSTITSRLAASRKDVLRNTKRAFCHLVIPAAGLWLLHDVLYFLAYHSGMESIPGWAGERVLSLLFASGQPVQIGGITVPALGVLWFLVALFVGKSMFDGLQLLVPSPVNVTAASAVLGVIGVVLGQTASLPFALDYALAVQPFFAFGFFLKRWRETLFSFKRFVVGSGGWMVTSLCIWYLCSGQQLDIALRSYPLFPLCFVMACFAVLTVSEASFLLMPIQNQSVFSAQ